MHRMRAVSNENALVGTGPKSDIKNFENTITLIILSFGLGLSEINVFKMGLMSSTSVEPGGLSLIQATNV